MKNVMALTAAAIGTTVLLSLAACGSASTSASGSSTPTAASTTSSVPGNAPAAAVACQGFRSATTAEVKADPNGTNLKAIKAFGAALIKATKPLNAAKPDPNPALESALGPMPLSLS
jgi:hypothetical protein